MAAFVLAVFLSAGRMLIGDQASLKAISELRFDGVRLVISFLIGYTSLTVAALAWHQIVRRFGIRQRAVTDLKIYIYCALGIVIPGGIWSIIGRSVYYENLAESRRAVAAASVLELLLTGTAGLCVYALTTLGAGMLRSTRDWVICITCLVITLILLQPRILNLIFHMILRRSGEVIPVESTRLSSLEISLWLMIQILVVTSGGGALYFLLLSFNPLPFSTLFLVIAAWGLAAAFATLFFWMPGSIFIRDISLGAVLSVNFSLTETFLIIVLIRLWSMISLMLAAIIVWLVFDFSASRFFQRIFRSSK